jgi:hypothetical protein
MIKDAHLSGEDDELNIDIDDLDASLDGLDIDLDDFQCVDLNSISSKQRYFKPKKHIVNVSKIKYENAASMADEIGDCKGRVFSLLSGSFIFGDLIEAVIVKNNWHVKRLVISTLSLSIANVESLRNLIEGGYVDKLDLIVSDYFYSHERNKLIKEIYSRLDIDDKFQLTVANTHTKIVTIETHCGRSIMMHGSANLRSSGCTEQVCIEDNAELIGFYIEQLVEPNIKYFSTIGKSTRTRGFI